METQQEQAQVENDIAKSLTQYCLRQQSNNTDHKNITPILSKNTTNTQQNLQINVTKSRAQHQTQQQAQYSSQQNGNSSKQSANIHFVNLNHQQTQLFNNGSNLPSAPTCQQRYSKIVSQQQQKSSLSYDNTCNVGSHQQNTNVLNQMKSQNTVLPPATSAFQQQQNRANTAIGGYNPAQQSSQTGAQNQQNICVVNPAVSSSNSYYQNRHKKKLQNPSQQLYLQQMPGMLQRMKDKLVAYDNSTAQGSQNVGITPYQKSRLMNGPTNSNRLNQNLLVTSLQHNFTQSNKRALQNQTCTQQKQPSVVNSQLQENKADSNNSSESEHNSKQDLINQGEEGNNSEGTVNNNSSKNNKKYGYMQKRLSHSANNNNTNTNHKSKQDNIERESQSIQITQGEDQDNKDDEQVTEQVLLSATPKLGQQQECKQQQHYLRNSKLFVVENSITSSQNGNGNGNQNKNKIVIMSQKQHQATNEQKCQQQNSQQQQQQFRKILQKSKTSSTNTNHQQVHHKMPDEIYTQEGLIDVQQVDQQIGLNDDGDRGHTKVYNMVSDNSSLLQRCNDHQSKYNQPMNSTRASQIHLANKQSDIASSAAAMSSTLHEIQQYDDFAVKSSKNQGILSTHQGGLSNTQNTLTSSDSQKHQFQNMNLKMYQRQKHVNVVLQEYCNQKSQKFRQQQQIFQQQQSQFIKEFSFVTPSDQSHTTNQLYTANTQQNFVTGSQVSLSATSGTTDQVQNKGIALRPSIIQQQQQNSHQLNMRSKQLFIKGAHQFQQLNPNQAPGQSNAQKFLQASTNQSTLTNLSTTATTTGSMMYPGATNHQFIKQQLSQQMGSIKRDFGNQIMFGAGGCMAIQSTVGNNVLCQGQMPRNHYSHGGARSSTSKTSKSENGLNTRQTNHQLRVENMNRAQLAKKQKQQNQLMQLEKQEILTKCKVNNPVPDITAHNWCILDDNCKNKHMLQFLNGRKENQKREIASLTKMMTFYTTLKLIDKYNIDPEDQYIHISKQCSKVIGTTANLQENDQMSLEQLFYAMMLPSGNDAAYCLADFFGRMLYDKKYQQKADGISSFQFNNTYIKYFIKEMNVNASKLKMLSTQYDSPHGLMNKNNFSTAYDQALLGIECMTIPKFREVVGTRIHRTRAKMSCKDKLTRYYWENTNKMLKLKDQGYIGCKTGITQPAGPCFAGYYEKDQHKYMLVILNSKTMDERWVEVPKLIEWAIQFKAHYKKLIQNSTFYQQQVLQENFISHDQKQPSPSKKRRTESEVPVVAQPTSKEIDSHENIDVQQPHQLKDHNLHQQGEDESTEVTQQTNSNDQIKLCNLI